MARPKKKLENGEDKYDIPTMCKKIDEYLESGWSIVPIFKECCLKNDWCYDHVLRMADKDEMLRRSIKKCHANKELVLERGALSGELNTTMAIFSLKQPVMGWKDKWETEAETKQEPISNITINVLEGKKVELEHKHDDTTE